MNRSLSSILVFAVLLTSCSKPGIRPDNGTKSPSLTAAGDPADATLPMQDIDGRPRTSPTPESASSGTPSSTALQEFKSPEKEVFDTKQVHFNIDMRDWKQISDGEGIQTFEKIKSDDNENVVAFRGEAVIPANLPKIATILNSPDLRKEWIDSLAESHGIEQTSALERLEYNHTKVPWPFQDRDFVYRIKVLVNQNPPTMLITMKSIEDPREPEHSGIVRGQIIYSYYYLKQLPGVRATKVVVEMALDPKGAIPKWLVTLSQKKWPYNTLLSLKKVSQREDLVVSQEIEDYFKEKKPLKAAKKKTKTRKKSRL
jgi:hypothetical protein